MISTYKGIYIKMYKMHQVRTVYDIFSWVFTGLKCGRAADIMKEMNQSVLVLRQNE